MTTIMPRDDDGSKNFKNEIHLVDATGAERGAIEGIQGLEASSRACWISGIWLTTIPQLLVVLFIIVMKCDLFMLVGSQNRLGGPRLIMMFVRKGCSVALKCPIGWNVDLHRNSFGNNSSLSKAERSSSVLLSAKSPVRIALTDLGMARNSGFLTRRRLGSSTMHNLEFYGSEAEPPPTERQDILAYVFAMRPDSYMLVLLMLTMLHVLSLFDSQVQIHSQTESCGWSSSESSKYYCMVPVVSTGGRKGARNHVSQQATSKNEQ